METLRPDWVALSEKRLLHACAATGLFAPPPEEPRQVSLFEEEA